MTSWKKILSSLIPLSLMLLAGCGGASETASAIPTATITITAVVQSPTATAIPTGTLPADVQCTGTSEGPALDVLNANQIVIPTNAVVTTGSQGSADGMQYSTSFQVLNLCASATTPAQINSFYRSHMSGNGWQASSTFPYMADPTTPCKTVCWEKPSTGTNTLAVALENVILNGEKTSFLLRYVVLKKN